MRIQDHIDSLSPSSISNRRSFMVSSIAAGFAVAVAPNALAETIKTSSDSLTAGEVKITTNDGEIPAYRAMPKDGKKLPVVLVVQEIFGVHEHIQDVCRRFAKLGYLAIAPALYARQGDVSKITSIAEIITSVVSKVPDAQVMSDLDATLAWARASDVADASKVAITGFCWGGRIVWRYAAHQSAVKAAVAWYGPLDKAPHAGDSLVVDEAAALKAPVLGLYGGADDGIPQAAVEKMRAAIKAAGGKSEIVVYPDTPHGFHADYRPSYRSEAAQDGWKRCLAWFKANGVS